MRKDKYYPGYHFRPERNWMNDPNGLIWRDGWYHLFFQHNPWKDTWGDIHWGHARSRDLIHWEMCPVALAPSTDLGEVHCYSGCAVEHEGNVYSFYTSIGIGERGPENGAQQWSAVNVDKELMVWKKHKTPALVQQINGEHNISMWRDPFIWKEDSVYRLLLSGTYDGKGCVALYESKDLEEWKFCSIFYRSKEYDLIECPNIMKFGEQYLLLYSPLDAVRYAVGTIDPVTKEFQVKSEGIFDYSIKKKGFYAPNVYLNDPRKRYLVMGCLFEGDRLDAKMELGWAGMQSLPREITLKDGKPYIWPADECRTLRKEVVNVLAGDAGEMRTKGDQLEVELFYLPQKNTEIEITVLEDEEGEEKTVLMVDYQKGSIFLNRQKSTVYGEVTKEDLIAPLEWKNELVNLDVFLDHSALEIYYNGEITMSARVFPKSENALGCRVSVTQGTMITSGKIYKLKQ